VRVFAPRDGAKTRCDVILDLTGGIAAVSRPPQARGHLRPDPKKIRRPW
jgi:hypothetical protein